MWMIFSEILTPWTLDCQRHNQLRAYPSVLMKCAYGVAASVFKKSSVYTFQC